MPSCRFGGREGTEIALEDHDDVVVVRTKRRGARHDVSPLSRRSRELGARLEPLFGFAPAGVGVYAVAAGASREVADVLDADPEIEFAGRGLRDRFGAPVVYTENLFVKFAGERAQSECADTLLSLGLEIKRPLGYATNAFFAGAPARTGRGVFEIAERLLERDDVELCHPELVREIGWNRAYPQQWHLQPSVIDGHDVRADANVTPAWEIVTGAGIVVAVIDDGVDIDHEEFASPSKIVAPFDFSGRRSDDPRPAHGDNHGTACSGVACADGRRGASGVAPDARLMPLRMVSLGGQDEADAFAWAADNGADVISCSWGPVDGDWWAPDDPRHDQVVQLPDATRLAIDYAVETGRDGRGCVITWAAGNGNESVDNDGYASYEKVIAVAACNDRSARTPYSDHGEAIWCAFPSNNLEPSLTPGIWTTDRTGADGYNSGDPSLGDAAGDYVNSFGGTSSACPGVAGVAALALARNRELRWDEVREILRRACERIDETGGKYDGDGHSRFYGYGRVDALRAVELAGEAR